MFMNSPVLAEEDGIKIKPELMEKEKLYHCIFKEKVLLFYKDSQDVLNCYEIDDEDISGKIKECSTDDELTSVLEKYIEQADLKH